MTTLFQKQTRFAEKFSELILFAIKSGYQVTYGETLRTPEMAAIYAKQGKGIKNSLHILKLAGDLNLFQNGKYLEKSEDYRKLGEFWESLSTPDFKHRWGGRFVGRADGNHFSIEEGGRA